MTRLEKLTDIDEMANFLNKVIQDCKFCPCMQDGCCASSKNCVEDFKVYLQKEYDV